MRRQRGSAAVMALVFMLFLSLAGGAWVTMLAHENATAMNDEKDQQAWYAAEAGMKRAKAELVAQTSQSEFKKWLTEDKTFSSNSKKIAVATGKEPSDTESDKAQYAVYIKDTTADASVATAGMGTSGDKYNIVSVGYYMDSTKIISVEDFTPVSGGGGGGGGGGDPTTKPTLGDNIVSATGIVTVENSNEGFIKGFFAGSKVIDETGAQFVSKNPHAGIGTYSGEFLTKMPDEIFDKNNYTYDGGILSGTLWKYTLEANKTYYMDFNSASVPNNFTVDASNAAGCTWVVSGINGRMFKLTGPTSGVPLTIVILDKEATVGFNMNNKKIRLRILAAGNFTYGSNGSNGFNGYGMFLSNGNMTLQSPIDQAYLSVNGDLRVDKSCNTFYGQALVSGNAYMGSGKLRYDSTVLDDPEFLLPSGMTTP